MGHKYICLFHDHLEQGMSTDSAFITTVRCIGLDGCHEDLKALIKYHREYEMEELFNEQSRAAV